MMVVGAGEPILCKPNVVVVGVVVVVVVCLFEHNCKSLLTRDTR
jgi:hypothetical protein